MSTNVPTLDRPKPQEPPAQQPVARPKPPPLPDPPLLMPAAPSLQLAQAEMIKALPSRAELLAERIGQPATQPPVMNPPAPTLVVRQQEDQKLADSIRAHPLAPRQHVNEQPKNLPDVGDIVLYGGMPNPATGEPERCGAIVHSVNPNGTLNLNIIMVGFLNFEANVPHSSALASAHWSRKK